MLCGMRSVRMVLLFMKKFEQMKRQYESLTGYLDETDLSDKNISATTADFDRLFELAWKTLKAYLYQELGIYEAKTGSPREILKLAAAQDLLWQDAIWFQMLKDRNDDAHRYRKSDAMIYISKIVSLYLPEIRRLIERLKELIPEEPWEDIRIPQDLLAYAFGHRKPLYELLEDIGRAYHCQTDAQIYESWEKYKKEYLFHS